MNVEEAAKKLGWSAVTLRAFAKSQRVPFCVAAQKKPGISKQWCYKINEAALDKYIAGEYTIQLAPMLPMPEKEGFRYGKTRQGVEV